MLGRTLSGKNDGYVIDSKLGSGGFGDTWIATRQSDS